MNSLQDLNAYSAASTIEFTDNRPSNVLFDLTTVPTPAAINIYEGENHSVPNPINITDIVNYQVCTTTYNVNISSFPAGTTVEWPTLPAYMSSSNADGIYSVTGFKTPSDWTTVKNPVVNIPDDISGTYVYPVSIVYFNGTVETTKTWNVTVNITAVDEMSASTLFDYTTSTTATILGTPTIIDADVAKTYTLIITPSKTTTVSTMSSAGTGGTSSFNGTTKVLTLVGTKTQVNSHLETISYTSTSVQEDFTLTYLLTNNLNAITDTKYQTLRCLDILYFGNVRTPSIYYNEDTVKIVQGGPLVTDASADGTGTYTVTVTPSTTAAVSTMSATAASNAKTITNTGSVKVKTAQSKFGGASANFTGLANGLITVENSPAFNFSNNDFTVEFWFYPTSGYPAGGIMNKIGSSVWGAHLGWSISYNNYQVEFWYGNPTPSNYVPLGAVYKIGQTSVLNSSSWTHIAFSMQGGTLRTFKNGVLEMTTAVNAQIADSSSFLQIGKGYYGNDGTGNNGGQWYENWKWANDPTQYTNGMLNGYLDEIRISKIARYTSTFTPATSAFTGDNYNSLLIHANGANDSTAFTDDVTGQTVNGTASFNNSTKVLTLSGNRDAVNNLIDLISLTPATDYRQNFSFTYRVTTPASNVAVKSQQALIGVADTDISNMNISRGYTGNNPNYLFATSTPVIGDTDPTAATFTVSLSCSSALGSWSTQRNVNVSGATSISYTGTKAACNAWFSTVIFYPKKDVYSTGSVTYTQSKNGTQQVNLTFTVIGSSGTYPDDGFVYGSPGSTVGVVSWTPTAEQAYYVGVIQLLLVGGGGGGGFGGGGGGGVKLYNNIPITAGTTYYGSIGAGGIAGVFNPLTQAYENGESGSPTTFSGGRQANGGTGGTRFDATNANGVFGGGNSYNLAGSQTYGSYGNGSHPTYVGGSAGGANGSAGTYQSSGQLPGTPGAAYTFEGLSYGRGGGGAKYVYNTNTHTKGSMDGNSTAGAGGGGGIGGTFKLAGYANKTVPSSSAEPGQNGRIKVWVRRV